ncbi:hypothetical protein FLONG3_7144 [Fusarium longipes]|uniref:Uncharacterized protein n=1 Tax=Fusarium longipes TaxID=694270 RepID=A0A395SG24_9HYPO|nr:hypothetical protein FLONG3_7144 [Fusarium longipes]
MDVPSSKTLDRRGIVTATETGVVTEDFEFQFTILPGEKEANANVISGYKCAKQSGAQTCVSIMTTAEYVYSCDMGRLYYETRVRIPTEYHDGKETKTLDEVTLFAPMFQLNWRSKDLSLKPTSTAREYTPYPTSRYTGPYSSPGLSTSAKAGIGIGVAVAVLGLIGGVFLLRRRRKKAKVPKTSESGPSDVEPKAELTGSTSPAPPHYAEGAAPVIAELDGAPRHEVSGTTAAQEMPGTTESRELPGSTARQGT